MKYTNVNSFVAMSKLNLNPVLKDLKKGMK